MDRNHQSNFQLTLQMWTLLVRAFPKYTPAPMGRWGHHWEKRLKYQVYYD